MSLRVLTGISAGEYRSRRRQLMDAVGSDGIIVLPAAPEYEQTSHACALCDRYTPSRQIIPNCQCSSLSSGIQRSVFLSSRSQIGCGRMAIPTPA